MRAIVDRVRDAIAPMRYEGGFQTGLYWFIRVAAIAVPVLVVLIVAGLVYAKVKGIEIQFFQ